MVSAILNPYLLTGDCSCNGRGFSGPGRPNGGVFQPDHIRATTYIRCGERLCPAPFASPVEGLAGVPSDRLGGKGGGDAVKMSQAKIALGRNRCATRAGFSRALTVCRSV